MKKESLTKLTILSILTMAAYIPTFIWMYERWTENDTYYSHGFLVPLISLFIIWLKRDKLSKTEIKPSGLGWTIFICGIAIHAISALWRVYFTSGVSLLFVLSGLILLFFGKRILRELFFALAFLIFMIPLPLVAIANVSFRLKIFAAQVSTIIVNLGGIRAIRDGSVIKTAHSYLVVEDPCSGIRSLIALIALGLLMAYFSRLSKPRKAILFAASVPIAVGSNIFRIVTLTFVSEIYGAKFATGFFHDTMGVVVFVVAFFSLSLVGKILE